MSFFEGAAQPQHKVDIGKIPKVLLFSYDFTVFKKEDILPRLIAIILLHYSNKSYKNIPNIRTFKNKKRKSKDRKQEMVNHPDEDRWM